MKLFPKLYMVENSLKEEKKKLKRMMNRNGKVCYVKSDKKHVYVELL